MVLTNPEVVHKLCAQQGQPPFAAEAPWHRRLKVCLLHFLEWRRG